jgi:hypothetical protein
MSDMLITLAKMVQRTFAIREASYVPAEIDTLPCTGERIPLVGGYYELTYADACQRASDELELGEADAKVLMPPARLMLSYPGEALEWARSIAPDGNGEAADEDIIATAVEIDGEIPHFVS